MSSKKKAMRSYNLSVIKILQQIKNGSIDPRKLPQKTRRDIVSILLMQLKPVSEIAAFLKLNERTIQRDKYELEQEYSKNPSSNATLKSLMDLVRKNEAALQNLKKLSNPKQVKAASYLWDNVQEQMRLLQNLGCLPR